MLLLYPSFSVSSFWVEKGNAIIPSDNKRVSLYSKGKKAARYEETEGVCDREYDQEWRGIKNIFQCSSYFVGRKNINIYLL